MASNQVNDKKQTIKLETVDRLMHIPIVESGWSYAGQVYEKLKESNNLINWTFGQAEVSFNAAVTTAMPAINIFQGPIFTIDKILNQSLEKVEEKVPFINLPPEKMYINTKQYVTDVMHSNILIADILNKANTVKNLALDSKYTGLAAETLDGALNVAEKYVDKYLPADANDTENEETPAVVTPQTSAEKAIKTIQHVDKLSRKLQRRLTQRTLAEAKALKEHSVEALQVLVHVVELITKDPKTALQKGQEMWTNLSKDEPENQRAPQHLEELITMLTRESARRVVHFVNFTSGVLKQLPDQVQTFTNKLIHLVQDLMKNGHLENINHTIYETARYRAHKLTTLLHQLNLHTTELLEQVAKSLEDHKEEVNNVTPNSNVSKNSKHQSSPKKHNKNKVNGIDN